MKGRRETSLSLLEAQERLIELRKLVRGRDGEPSPSGGAHGRAPSNTDNPFQQPDVPLPEHIGWGSEPLANILREIQAQDLRERRINQEAGIRPCQILVMPTATPQARHQHNPPRQALHTDRPQRVADATSGNALSAELIKLYPDIALALLRTQLVAPGRLWLLLRYIDAKGRGWIEIDEARRLLTKKESTLRAFGWRQMRKLLSRGDGLFWRRDGQRIWLRSTLKVAASLAVDHFSHQPVGLPAKILVQSIGMVRAHFYASFHSGRMPDTEKNGLPPPVSRATLQALCQTSRRTLRHYDRRAGIHSQRNLVIGKSLTVADHQNQAWKRGRAVFKISDHDGRAGREGATYTAWQLPNSYIGPHKKQPKGRQKRMNRKLTDLFMKGMTGNGDRAKHSNHGGRERWFFESGVAATTNYNRRPEHDIYWRGRRHSVLNATGQCQLWHWLPPQSDARQHCKNMNLEPARRGVQ